RSHRRDQERFYNYLSFYSCEDLQIQMKRYLRRSNRIPMSVLEWKTPIQKRQELENAQFC
ncbi:MAG: IS481 family transposase, partial [Oscillospiraceae bacterium]|nr:IS481 family transposase [Oscillospiraceae bacterium]